MVVSYLECQRLRQEDSFQRQYYLPHKLKKKKRFFVCLCLFVCQKGKFFKRKVNWVQYGHQIIIGSSTNIHRALLIKEASPLVGKDILFLYLVYVYDKHRKYFISMKPVIQAYTMKVMFRSLIIAAYNYFYHGLSPNNFTLTNTERSTKV